MFNFPGSVLPQAARESKSKTKGDRTISQAVSQQQQFNFLNSRQNSPYQKLLISQMQSGSRNRSQRSQEKVLCFKNSPTTMDLNSLLTPFLNPTTQPQPIIKPRKFPTEPIVSLDAPDVEDNFYISPLDWSAQNYIALASSSKLYAYNYTQKQVVLLNAQQDSSEIMCVRWNRQLPQLLVSGNRVGQIQLWDVDNQQIINNVRVSRSTHPRVANCITVSENTIACGTQNAMLCIYDPRISRQIAQLAGHQEAVLGIRFQNDGHAQGPYLASSGADKQVLIWDLRKRDTMVHRLVGHTGLAKALDWNPFKSNVLCTGGGEGDTSVITWLASTGIKLYDEGEILANFKTNSQITSLIYSDPTSQYQELYTGHGYNDNALRMWNVQLEYKLGCELFEHKKRVIGLCLGPGGKLLCSLGGDELMKIWPIEEESLFTDNSSKKRKLLNTMNSYR